jgi:tRNA-Thr(GGU) m(6)t(6)A37 methyltransferase TsaA
MDENMTLKVIARIENDFTSKFGIPRQSGIADKLSSKIIFEPEYRNPDALRGIDGFSHLWLMWGFSKVEKKTWSPTVRPPRLGGNKRMGVFATRSPYRPNPIGLSSVRLGGIEHDAKLGDILIVYGADLLNGTPIYDIKPFLPYTDNHTDATGGFAPESESYELTVDFPDALLERLPESSRDGAKQILAQDPRPSYQHDPEREYGLAFAGADIRFKVADGVIKVLDVII